MTDRAKKYEHIQHKQHVYDELIDAIRIRHALMKY